MSDPTWRSDVEPEVHRPGFLGWLLVAFRGTVLGTLVFGCFGILLLVRLVERPLFGRQRPWTPQIVVFVCRNAFRVLGIRLEINGAPVNRPGVIVSNHSSWLDIFTLNAAGPLYFVAKSEVARWPGIGWLARGTGTVFVQRERREAGNQKTVFEERLADGHRILFFPEGTSSDGRRVLPFKSTLFAALFSDRLPELWVQPVTVVYCAPEGKDPRYYGWWGSMEFGPHVVQTLGTRRQGQVEVTWHEPLLVADFAGRKTLAAEAEARVRSTHPQGSA
ncbi:MAG: 1-acyl-sn-glycerol-3-phosphate acyltransferase, partial [Boseongicola sp. SB0676_bin_33]|nr:1-acyl-sn-glycerol-3-phosphate acyltransferase [Boseongicola sp. SB0676_bin_33]